jgi:hypothetical protein
VGGDREWVRLCVLGEKGGMQGTVYISLTPPPPVLKRVKGGKPAWSGVKGR